MATFGKHLPALVKWGRPLVWVALLSVIVPPAVITASKPEWTEATGQAAILDNDTIRARDKAIADAVRRAVEQVIGTMVSSETVVENYQLISDKILTKSKGYVRKYEVLEEGESDPGVFEVKIKAQVASGNLSQDLDGILAVLRAKNMPRVLIMVAEQNVGGQSSSWWHGGGAISLDAVENVLIDQWSSKGITFIDRQVLDGKLRADAPASSDPSNQAAKEFAKLSGAEVVIIGKAIANDHGPVLNTRMRSLRSTMSLRALDVDTGKILATVTHSAATAHVDPVTGGTIALKKGATQAGKKLLKKILANWEKDVAGSSTITLTVNNVRKSKYVRILTRAVRKRLRGVDEIRQRGFRNRVASIEISMKGTTQDLAEALEDKPFGRFEIEVEEITANTVTGVLIPIKSSKRRSR